MSRLTTVQAAVVSDATLSFLQDGSPGQLGLWQQVEQQKGAVASPFSTHGDGCGFGLLEHINLPNLWV